MGLKNTVGSVTSTMPEPAAHLQLRAPGGLRRTGLAVLRGGDLLEANETTTLDDLATTGISFGTGSLLSKSSYAEMTDSRLIGFGKKEPACEPSCFTQIPIYSYGLGVIRSGRGSCRTHC